MGLLGGDRVEQAWAVTGDAPEPSQRRRRWATRRLIGVLVVLATCAGIGDATSPMLVVHTPLLLVALSPRARHVLLVSPVVGAVPLVAVALVRRLLPIPVLYRLGRLHGSSSLGWVERHYPRTGRWTRRVERWFERAEVPVVLLLPGLLTAYLAGCAGMAEPVLLTLSALGILARLSVLLVVGDVLVSPLTWLLGTIGDHQGKLIILSVGLTVLQVVRHRRRARRRPVDPG
jgi:membrane protein DedA with SNARE-associated domain